MLGEACCIYFRICSKAQNLSSNLCFKLYSTAQILYYHQLKHISCTYTAADIKWYKTAVAREPSKLHVKKIFHV